MDKPETYKFITEDAYGITIALRHKWRHICEDDLSELDGYIIKSSLITANGIYHILEDVSAIMYKTYARSSNKLLKYTTDEETGKIRVLVIDIGAEEAAELMGNISQFVWL